LSVATFSWYRADPSVRLIGAAHTDRGVVRRENQDSYGFSSDIGLYLVADGMGGRAAGKRASEEAVRSIVDAVRAAAQRTGAERLRSAVDAANRRLWTLAEHDPELHGMGTTVAAVLVEGDVAHVAHVGDSRVYRLRGGELRPLTRDHSYLAEFSDRGIDVPDGKRALYDNVLSRAVGTGATVEVDVVSEALVVGDVYLLCSDGVYKVVDVETMTALVGGGEDLERSCQAIVAAANAAGGPDNSTVILVRVLDGPDGSGDGP
jgi:protein phosphatase